MTVREPFMMGFIWFGRTNGKHYRRLSALNDRRALGTICSNTLNLFRNAASRTLPFWIRPLAFTWVRSTMNRSGAVTRL